MSDRATLPITATITEFSRISGLGRTSIYELLNSGKIRGVLICGRRLIVVASYIEYIEGAIDA